MSFKQYIPDIGKEWDAYWKKTSLDQELELVDTDGLKPIFEKYLSKRGKILEAGCGMGKWVITLAKQGYNIEGADANDYAIKKLKAFFKQAKVEKADIKALPYPDGSFDSYLSLGVVEHFEEGPQKALGEAYRVLRRGGTAIIEVPFDSFLRRCVRTLNQVKTIIKTPARLMVEALGLRNNRQQPKMRFYEYRYTKNELLAFMKDAGFINIRIYPKDDLSKERSIALWLDFPKLISHSGKIFELNGFGRMAKRLLNSISPYTYAALIVAVARKP
ncbi:MAG: hypothetical protein A3F04_01195 [Candidatus Chisholmbacteria bacterium RIFCSPHIGHO2_12_FULL_49_9]|uniref:Methyltransferase type 11 domain-containing protein n=1 Tax=Candidatus Chisholmbacteria bacterium RIFCSPHIGHO2_01_FULL_52_32 TaxID=1797591 RepID=A0A1G1VT17_9BACT|nr:MAG: hypothetical protein A2786_03570 [Candidatus Chisholmbacteria bacterium RIFCSPHIGHO2_01_FULL_52_32]OGY20078.1 MAG: hypothetical protein A2900_03175 [Candidatus Chisholmbacteria bacterium RIFCSPLOWO2_01_FULL_50_28]OGY21366.1 MAG: hypothetical protein A3F04_01195 [Candidatus Chisholmbacteria bacterium RIFCSPHIGHO2_12_FULL_49_9]